MFVFLTRKATMWQRRVDQISSSVLHLWMNAQKRVALANGNWKAPVFGLVTLTTALRRQGRHAEPQTFLQRELPLLVVVLVLLTVVLIRIRTVAVKHPHQ